MLLSNSWKDFEVLDTRPGEKLERWGDIILRRPDPQVIWESAKNDSLWDKANAAYMRSSTGGGHWQFFGKVPDKWEISYQDLKFFVKLMGFKHTGLFPEQATNWDYIINKITGARRDIRVLNLFAYTGGATIAAAAAGATQTVHVDASKGMVAWAKENAVLSGLGDAPIRFIVDDVLKFVARESRRGNKYDAIIMDPPSYGRGPAGELWKIEDEIFPLIEACMEILSSDPLFFIINSYTTGLSPVVMSNILNLTLGRRYGGDAKSYEIGLPITSSGLILPCGCSARWDGKRNEQND